MKRIPSSIWLGLFLLVGAGLLLAYNTNLLSFDAAGFEIVIGILCAALGLGLVVLFWTRRTFLWASIAGMTLLALGAATYVSETRGQPQPVVPTATSALNGDLLAAIFLVAIGISFLFIFLSDRRDQWWAILPGGVLITLGGLSYLAPNLGGILMLSALFIGIGIICLLTWLALRGHSGQSTWFALAAALLILIGVLFFSIAQKATTMAVWPAIPGVLGLLIIVWAIASRRQRAVKPVTSIEPALPIEESTPPTATVQPQYATPSPANTPPAVITPPLEPTPPVNVEPTPAVHIEPAPAEHPAASETQTPPTA